MTSSEYAIRLVEDRPARGMWHCGPNAAWVEVTHMPTMISARAFDESHHHAKEAAMACCQMMVEQSRLLKCQFPERLSPDTDAHRDLVEALNAVLDTCGARGTYHAIKYDDAVERAESLLAALTKAEVLHG